MVEVLLEAVDAVPNPVHVGHSTGGEYLLSTPELEPRLASRDRPRLLLNARMLLPLTSATPTIPKLKNAARRRRAYVRR